MMFPSGMDFPRDMMTDMHTSLMDLDPHDDHFRAHDRHLSSHPNRGGGNPPPTYMHTQSYSFVRGPDGKTVEHAQTTRRAPGVLERERYVRDGVRREETAEHQRALGSIEGGHGGPMRGRTVKRTRIGGGPEQEEERVFGMGAEDRGMFEQEWGTRRAALPTGFDRSRPALGGGGGGRRQATPLLEGGEGGGGGGRRRGDVRY